MAPIPTVTYASLKDHTALPVVRTICSSGTPEFRVTSLPEYDFSSLLEEYSRAGRDACVSIAHQCSLEEMRAADNFSCKQNLRIFKRSITTANPPLPTGVISLMMSLHALSGHIFNDLSHALELPWEKYLAELHEFAADGDDELRVFGTADVERAWASLVWLPSSIMYCSCSEEEEENLSNHLVQTRSWYLIQPAREHVSSCLGKRWQCFRRMRFL